MACLDDVALDQLFRTARSVHTFTDDPVTDTTLRRLYDLLKWGPTAFNAQPARYVFVRSAEAKQRLAVALSRSNRAKTLAAPVTAIVAYDTRFFEHLPCQFLDQRFRDLFSADDELAEATSFRNGTLQGAYLLIAARALGLAVGPMSGFDAEAVNREFFPDRRYRVNFLANIGYAAVPDGRPRGPRLEFAAVAQLI